MRILLPSAKRKARIEIIPLIDIVFFLLATFVMVSMSMVKNQGVPVRLPSAVTSSVQDRQSLVTVTVAQNGDLYLDKEKFSMDGLEGKLRSMKASTPDLRVFINGDEEASFGQAIQVLDKIRLLDIQKVSIQTKNKK